MDRYLSVARPAQPQDRNAAGTHGPSSHSRASRLSLLSAGVGKGNYRYFFLFLTSLNCLLWFSFSISIWHLVLATNHYRDLRASEGDPVSTSRAFWNSLNHIPVASFLVAIYDFLGAFFVTLLYCFHIYLVAHGVTTNEQVREEQRTQTRQMRDTRRASASASMYIAAPHAEPGFALRLFVFLQLKSMFPWGSPHSEGCLRNFVNLICRVPQRSRHQRAHKLNTRTPVPTTEAEMTAMAALEAYQQSPPSTSGDADSDDEEQSNAPRGPRLDPEQFFSHPLASAHRFSGHEAAGYERDNRISGKVDVGRNWQVRQIDINEMARRQALFEHARRQVHGDDDAVSLASAASHRRHLELRSGQAGMSIGPKISPSASSAFGGFGAFGINTASGPTSSVGLSIMPDLTANQSAYHSPALTGGADGSAHYSLPPATADATRTHTLAHDVSEHSVHRAPERRHSQSHSLSPAQSRSASPTSELDAVQDSPVSGADQEAPQHHHQQQPADDTPVQQEAVQVAFAPTASEVGAPVAAPEVPSATIIADEPPQVSKPTSFAMPVVRVHLDESEAHTPDHAQQPISVDTSAAHLAPETSLIDDASATSASLAPPSPTASN